MISPSDYLSGGAGLLYGGQSGLGRAALGASVGLANKGLRTYENAGRAKILDFGSQKNIPTTRLFEMMSENPRAISVLFQRSLSPWGSIQEKEAQ